MKIYVRATVGSEYDGPSMLAESSTVGAAVQATLGRSYSADTMQVRVNNSPATADTVLREGDLLSIDPRKVAGAK